MSEKSQAIATQDSQRLSLGTRVKLGLGVLLLALVIVVIVQNTQVVSLNLLLWQFPMSQIVLMGLSLLVGFILGWTLTARRRVK